MVEYVQVAHTQAIELPHYVPCVTQQHRIRVPAPQAALPTVGVVVRLGERVECRIFCRQWPCTVACEVAAQHAVVAQRRVKAQIVCHCLHGGRMDSAPTRMRVKTMPFIEEHTLRTFKNHRGRCLKNLTHSGS